MSDSETELNVDELDEGEQRQQGIVILCGSNINNNSGNASSDANTGNNSDNAALNDQHPIDNPENRSQATPQRTGN